MKTYAIIEGRRILKMSKRKRELIDYRNSFPEEERRGMWIAERQGGG